jgi:hypothetical protein
MEFLGAPYEAKYDGHPAAAVRVRDLYDDGEDTVLSNEEGKLILSEMIKHGDDGTSDKSIHYHRRSGQWFQDKNAVAKNLATKLEHIAKKLAPVLESILINR